MITTVYNTKRVYLHYNLVDVLIIFSPHVRFLLTAEIKHAPAFPGFISKNKITLQTSTEKLMLICLKCSINVGLYDVLIFKYF